MAALGPRKHSLLHPDSTLLCLPADGGKQGEQDLFQCRHCGRHWLVGAAIATNVQHRQDAPDKCFGFCARCNGPTCPGAPCSTHCVPIEQQLENMEAGRDLLTPKAPMISTVDLILP